MKPGDLVRFREITSHAPDVEYTDWKIGLLLQYYTWEKIATILYDQKELRIAARDVQMLCRAKRNTND